MKHLKLIIASVLLIVVITFNQSCTAFHTGYMTNSAALSSANFFYAKRNIKGSSSATYFLGIGGLKKETLVDGAKQNMLNSYTEFGDNQTLANLTVNFKTAYILFGIFSKVTCTITADVVEFKGQEKENKKKKEETGDKEDKEDE